MKVRSSRIAGTLLSGLLGLSLVSLPAQALDLLESYRLALANEPTWLAARATAEASREFLPQARSYLLPSVQASGSASQAMTTQSRDTALGTVEQDFDYPSYNLSLSIRQPLLRMQNWAGYQQAKARVVAAEADLAGAQNDMAGRVAGAYFNALFSEDMLNTILVQKAATEAQLKAYRQALASGLGTRTDIDDAQARFDLIVAEELDARQNIEYSRRQLESLIGQTPGQLARLDADKIELSATQADTLDVWITRIEANNPIMKSLIASLEVATRERDKARYGQYPTIDLFAQKSITESDTDVTINQRYDTTKIGIQANMPLYSGGLITSQQRQASARLDEVRMKLEALRRALQLEARKQYQALLEGYSRIRALEQAIRSAEQAILSNQKGIKVGTRTTLDLLAASQKKAEAENQLAKARYEYLLARIQLSLLAGMDEEGVLAESTRYLVETPQKP